MKVSVVIPNYNGAKFLENCIKSLKSQSYKDFETIIVDNNSKDSSVSFIHDNYKDIKLIALQDNFGFSRAVNEGIKASCAEYVILLNNDTEVDVDFVKNLLQSIENDTKTFSVASKMIQLKNPTLLDSAGDLYTIIGWGVNRGAGRSSKLYNKKQSVFSACAGAAIYRKSVFDEIGLFDESHFAYLEDLDICYRALRYGYKNKYEPTAICKHYGSGSSGSKYNEFKIRLSSRNSIYLNYKNMTLIQKIINFIPLLLGYFVKYLFFAKKGFGKIYINGLKEGFRTRRNCSKPKYKISHIPHYIKIEFMLILDTFAYVFDWILRHIH